MKNNFNIKATLFRYGFYNIGLDDGSELNIPLRTQSANKINEIMSNTTKGVVLPTKIVPISDKEKQALEELGIQIPKGSVQQKVVDTTSKQYKEIEQKQAKYGKYLAVAQHVDLSFKYDDGKALWEILELKSDMDYLGLCEFFVNFGMDEDMLGRLYGHIGTIKVLGASDYKEAIEKMSIYDAFYTKLENYVADEKE